MESDEDFFKKYYHVKEHLKNVTKELVDANEAALDEADLQARRNNVRNHLRDHDEGHRHDSDVIEYYGGLTPNLGLVRNNRGIVVNRRNMFPLHYFVPERAVIPNGGIVVPDNADIAPNGDNGGIVGNNDNIVQNANVANADGDNIGVIVNNDNIVQDPNVAPENYENLPNGGIFAPDNADIAPNGDNGGIVGNNDNIVQNANVANADGDNIGVIVNNDNIVQDPNVAPNVGIVAPDNADIAFIDDDVAPENAEIVPNDVNIVPNNDDLSLNPDGVLNNIGEMKDVLPKNEEPPRYMTNKMIKMLVQESPFTRLLVLNEDCYYMLNQKNILRCVKWDETNERWLATVLARYYACNMYIADISIYNDDVYMLLKTGLLFKLDRAGRNFLPDRRFDRYMTPAQFEFSRMIYGAIDSRIPRAGSVTIPEYGISKNLILSNQISVLVSVPLDKEFQINEEGDKYVIEYPGLTCATQHGDVLLLGFTDGRVEICISSEIITKNGKCEITANVQDCPGFPKAEDEYKGIIALEVCEELHSHHIFAATRSSVYRLTVTYPQHIRDMIGLNYNL